MKLHQAIEELEKPENKEMWIRPVHWKGWEQAYCIHKGDMMLVPSSRGGEYHMSYNVNVLKADWELVHPDVVLSGK